MSVTHAISYITHTFSLAELRQLAIGSTTREPGAKARYLLAQRYATTTGVVKDQQQTASWHALAADIGKLEAQRQMAYAYLKGRDVQRDDAEGSRLKQHSASD